MLTLTTNEFRRQLKIAFDQVDQGEKVLIRRGAKKLYTLTPVDDDDLYFTPEMEAKIARALQQVKDGNVLKKRPDETMEQFVARGEQWASTK